MLKAQIVVARSYVLSMRTGRHSKEGFEFCDQPHCQVFHGIAREEDYPGLASSLRDTRGEYISYRGRAIAAFYHHNCGGMTSAIEDVWPAPARPYLKAVVEPAGGICRAARARRGKSVSQKKRLTDCFINAGLLKKKDVLKDIQIARIDQAGRAMTLSLLTGKKSQTLSVGRFRNLINQHYKTELLRSALFVISSDGDDFIVQGRGWGHGVGFCQEGAMWLSRRGKSYQEILQHYFPRTELRTL